MNSENAKFKLWRIRPKSPDYVNSVQQLNVKICDQSVHILVAILPCEVVFLFLSTNSCFLLWVFVFLGTTMYIFLAKYIKAYNSKPGTIQNEVVTILTDAGQTCGLYTHQLLGMRVICNLVPRACDPREGIAGSGNEIG
jgi:hypothetical protein